MILKKLLITIVMLQPLYLFSLDVTVHIENRKSNKSTIYCGLFKNPQGFPADSKQRFKGDTAKLVNGKYECKFSDLVAGKYAVSLLEDLNGNGVMDSNMVGYPKEPWGVSNNAPMHAFGPPTFDEASFQLKDNKIINIRLNQ